MAELLRCGAATLGPSAALASTEAYRQALQDGLGTDPGPALQALQQQLLARHRAAGPPRRAPRTQPLLGRDGDIAALADLLRSSRVTSIVGPGGLGKTRLAHAVSRRATQRVVQVVALAGVGADADVAGEVASALARVSPLTRPASTSGRPTWSPASRPPRSSPALLVLDNCEHVLGGAADLVGALVSMTQDLRVLTTSRAPLGLSSEAVYLLPELSLPTAVELFIQRARAARPGADLPAEVVAEICRHLDGLPLAVELAARAGPGAVGGRDRPPRWTASACCEAAPRTPSAADPRGRGRLELDLLEPSGRAAMRALSVFPGGFTADAAAGARRRRRRRRCRGPGAPGRPVAAPGGRHPGRGTLRMLETVREFSTAQREAAGRPTGRSAASWPGPATSAWPPRRLRGRPGPAGSGSGPSRRYLAQALRHGLARADGDAWRPPPPCSGACGSSSPSTRCWCRSPPRRPGCCRTSGPGPASSRRPGRPWRCPPPTPSSSRGPGPCARWSPFAGCPRRRRTPWSRPWRPCSPPRDRRRPVRGSATATSRWWPGPPTASSYFWENEGDLDSAVAAARRTLEAFEQRKLPTWRPSPTPASAMPAGRAEGEEALRHLLAVLPVLEQLGIARDLAGLQWWLVLANLQVGDVDQAERWLEQTAPSQADEPVGSLTYGLGVRAEILLARGEVEAGLRLWRRAADLLATPTARSSAWTRTRARRPGRLRPRP